MVQGCALRSLSPLFGRPGGRRPAIRQDDGQGGLSRQRGSRESAGRARRFMTQHDRSWARASVHDAQRPFMTSRSAGLPAVVASEQACAPRGDHPAEGGVDCVVLCQDTQQEPGYVRWTTVGGRSESWARLPNKGMKQTKLSAAPTLAPQAALSRRCRLMPAISATAAGTASQLIPRVGLTSWSE